MKWETIELKVDRRGVATLLLNRPDKHNAFNALVISEMRDALGQIAADSSIRVVVLTGTGKSFCAGADLGWMKSQAEKDRTGKIEEAMALGTLLRDFNCLPKPVIGRVNGQAFGGGIGLMAVCDIVVAVESARFALTETKLGLIPATIGPYVVGKLGQGPSRRIFMNGREFSAHEAQALGLVSEVVPVDRIDAVVEAEIQWFLQCAPGAVADAKALLLELTNCPQEGHLDLTARRLADRWETEETGEGIRCFFERRRPSWHTEKTTQ